MSYEPQPGTIPFKAIEHLKTLNHEWIATAPLLEAIGHPGANSFATNMAWPVKHGVVESRRKQGSNSYEWRLAKDPKPLGPLSPPDDEDTAPLNAFVQPDPAIGSPFTIGKLIAGQAMPQASKQAPKPEADGFLCALYSDGRLLIKSGEVEHTLPVEHTRKLCQFLDRIALGDQHA